LSSKLGINEVPSSEFCTLKSTTLDSPFLIYRIVVLFAPIILKSTFFEKTSFFCPLTLDTIHIVSMKLTTVIIFFKFFLINILNKRPNSKRFSATAVF
jgi:hypothetical protein